MKGLIRTKQSVDINPKERFSGVVYMRAHSRKHDDVKGLIKFTIDFMGLALERKQHNFQVLDEQGQPMFHESGTPIIESGIMVIPRLRHLKTISPQEITFKEETFKAQIGEVWVDEYAQVLMQQIAYVNSKTWNGSEIMQTYYWNLGLNDMEVVTEQMYTELTTPYREI